MNRVSILTRPEERVLPVLRHEYRLSQKFQSSPALKSGCYATHQATSVSLPTLFQSSPALKSGCYLAEVPIIKHEYGLFQSSPALKSGCYRCSEKFNSSCGPRFNPHPP